MADYTITRYLKLKIADDLSSDAKSNLLKIDALGATFLSDSTETLQVRSRGDVTIEPESPDVGGSGNGTGNLTIGTPNNSAQVTVYSTFFRLKSALSLENLQVGETNYLNLQYASAAAGGNDIDFVLDVGNPVTDTRSISILHDGELVITDAVQSLSNKTISGIFSGPLVGNVTGDVTGNLTGNASTATVASGLLGSSLSGDITNVGNALTVNLVGGQLASSVASATTTTLASTSNNTPGTIVRRDGSGNFAANNITAQTLTATSVISGTFTGSLDTANLTGVVAIANGGTGNNGSNRATALLNLLPAASGKALSVLRVNASENGIEWATGAGVGTVTLVSATAPLTVTGDPATNPTINLPVATALANGYLSSTDWSTFNGKEPAITSGTTGQYWRGDKSWQTLDKSVVGLNNVDNTSDANKPISSATQSALNAKYDASNPASYIDAAGAKSAAVVNSTAGNETDQAASVSAMKSYVAATGGGATLYSWLTSDGATKSITHSLNKNTVSVTVYDENGEDILVDTIDRTSNNAVTLTSSVAPTGTWSVVIRP